MRKTKVSRFLNTTGEERQVCVILCALDDRDFQSQFTMKMMTSPHVSVTMLLNFIVIWLILFFFFLIIIIGSHAVKESIFSVYIKALSIISGFWLILNKFTRGFNFRNNEVSQHKCNLAGCHSSNSSLLQNFPSNLQNLYVKLRIFPLRPKLWNADLHHAYFSRQILRSH